MGISGHFDIENYAWRLSKNQNICQHCNFSCMIFSA